MYVIGATNRPDMIDPAMVRPGRLDKLLYVDLPSPSERLEILRTHTKRTPIAEADWTGISSIVSSDACDGFSGADLAALVREAASLALRAGLEDIGAFENDADDGSTSFDSAVDGGKRLPPMHVSVSHFFAAAEKTRPSVSREQRQRYERMRDKYAGVPARGRRTRAEREAELLRAKIERESNSRPPTGAIGAAGSDVDAEMAERVERVDIGEVMLGLS